MGNEQGSLLFQQLKYFCYLQTRNHNQMIIQFAILGLFFLIFLLIIKKICNLKSQVLNSTVKCSMAMLLLWSLAYVIKLLFSIILYFHIKDAESQDYNFLSNMSQIFYAIDQSPEFILQYNFLLIPYHWTGGIIDLFNELGLQYEGKQIVYRKIVSICLKVSCLVLQLRFLLIPLLLLFEFIKNQTIMKILCIVIESYLLIESLISIFILIAAFRIVNKDQQIKNLIDEQELQILKNQYIILIIALLLRVSLNTWIIVIKGVVLGSYFNIQNCEINGDSGMFYFSNIITVIYAIFNHFIPIIVVLRIFSVQKKQSSVSSSLIISPSPEI